jgi:hypothetical protein
MATDVENWDDDADFQGDLFGHSLSTQPTSLSSRLSVRSESLAADEDWQVLVTPNDENSHLDAITSAKQVGIPIPQSVPQSALLGGTIKRLGKKKSKPTVADDWGDDFDIGEADAGGGGQLKLAGAKGAPTTPANNNDDDFDTEWAEGSLGIRFGGTRRDARGRSSSVSAMSPSLGSCMTVESEDDDLNGLVLPNEPIDFSAKLRQRQEREKEEERKEPPTSVPVVPESIAQQAPPRTQADEDDDLLSGLDFGDDDILDFTKKRTINRNIKVENPKSTPPPARTTTTTLTFTDKPAVSRIPRPTNSATKPSKLDPVYESGASQAPPPPAPQFPRITRITPTTTSAQLLRSKRSAPVLGRQPALNSKPSIPFLPAGISTAQSHHVTAKGSTHFRQPSDHERPTSPQPSRSFSRMSVADLPRGTPSRAGARREGFAPAALARVAINTRSIHVPKKRGAFGTGHELDQFDDLPTSASKESKFVKEPVARGLLPKTLRRKDSRANLQLGGMPERSAMTTPAPSTVPSTPIAPPTPRSGYFPNKIENTPRFARDTAASRIAREQRISNTTSMRPRSEVLPPTTNWKAQVAMRSPHNSPSASRGKKKDPKGPMLIKNMSSTGNIKSKFSNIMIFASRADMAIAEKGMVFNAVLQRWEGNEHVLDTFNNPSSTTLPLHPTHKDNFSHHHHTNSFPSALALGLREQNTLPRHASPPRPALISQVNGMKGPRIERGMVFDPDRMKWLKVDPRSLTNNFDSSQLTPGSVSIDDEEDPFAGIDDLPDEKSSKVIPGSGGANKENEAGGDWALGEEFDLGPTFIRRQRAEESEWRRWTDKWFSNEPSMPFGREREEWKWDIRRVAERS